MAVKGRWLAAAAILLVFAAVPLQAHHSLSAEYDISAPIELHGTVTRVDWINPHIFIHLDVKGPDGTHETWQVETNSPSTLRRAKVSRKMLAVGTAVAFKGFRSNNGSKRAAAREVIFADGATYSLEPQAPTYTDWLRNSFPASIGEWIPYVVIGLPVAVLIVGLFLWRSQGKKAHA